jgi:hypothetical protein
MLLLPELDTYGAIPAYARHLDDPVAANAFTMLLIRGRRRLMWDLHDFVGSKADGAALVAYRLGMPLDAFDARKDSGQDTGAKAADIASMSEDQKKELYLSAMLSAGMNIDPGVFMNQKDKTSGTADNGAK